MTGESKGYAFVTYNSFEAVDLAIASMNNEFLANKPPLVCCFSRQLLNARVFIQ